MLLCTYSCNYYKLNGNSCITCHTVYTQMLIHLAQGREILCSWWLLEITRMVNALFPGSPVLSRWQPCKISTPGTKSVKISTQEKAYSFNFPRVNPPSPSWGFMHFSWAGPRVSPGQPWKYVREYKNNWLLYFYRLFTVPYFPIRSSRSSTPAP